MQVQVTEHIINGCIEQKRDAQYALHKLCYQEFMRICLRYTKSKDEANDIANAAFLKILTKINTYNKQNSFEAWMQRIVVNTALDHLKTEKKYSSQEDLNNAATITNHDNNKNLEANDLLKMLQTLTVEQRNVFNLFAIEGYSHAEIADLLGITEASSKWHLFNARKQLQEMVNNY